jgi:hypothetical protein
MGFQMISPASPAQSRGTAHCIQVQFPRAAARVYWVGEVAGHRGTGFVKGCKSSSWQSRSLKRIAGLYRGTNASGE